MQLACLFMSGYGIIVHCFQNKQQTLQQTVVEWMVLQFIRRVLKVKHGISMAAASMQHE
jgi:hypothetical protein